MTRKRIDYENNYFSKTSAVNVSNQGGGLFNKLLKSLETTLPAATYLLLLTFANFERAKIQPGLVNQLRKLGQN